MIINFVRDLLLSQPLDDFTLTNWLVTLVRLLETMTGGANKVRKVGRMDP